MVNNFFTTLHGTPYSGDSPIYVHVACGAMTLPQASDLHSVLASQLHHTQFGHPDQISCPLWICCKA